MGAQRYQAHCTCQCAELFTKEAICAPERIPCGLPESNLSHTHMLRKRTRGFFSLTRCQNLSTWMSFLHGLANAKQLRQRAVPYLPHSSQRLESLAKHARILLLQLPSGKQCQINRVEGTEEAPYLTKVDALHIYPFKDCQLMLIVPPLLDHRALLTSTTRLVVSKVWSYEPSNNTKLNSTPIHPITPQASCAASQQRPTTKGQGSSEPRRGNHQKPGTCGRL